MLNLFLGLTRPPAAYETIKFLRDSKSMPFLFFVAELFNKNKLYEQSSRVVNQINYFCFLISLMFIQAFFVYKHILCLLCSIYISCLHVLVRS
jgi:hypothetical protein